MSTVYQAQIDTAKRLIYSKGQDVTMNREGITSIDPVTQVVTENAGSEVMRAVVLPVSSTRRGMNEAAIKDLRNSKVRKLLIAAGGLTLIPTTSDTFDLGGTLGADWKVYGIDELAPDGTPIIFSLIVTK